MLEIKDFKRLFSNVPKKDLERFLNRMIYLFLDNKKIEEKMFKKFGYAIHNHIKHITQLLRARLKLKSYKMFEILLA